MSRNARSQQHDPHQLQRQQQHEQMAEWSGAQGAPGFPGTRQLNMRTDGGSLPGNEAPSGRESMDSGSHDHRRPPWHFAQRERGVGKQGVEGTSIERGLRDSAAAAGGVVSAATSTGDLEREGADSDGGPIDVLERDLDQDRFEGALGVDGEDADLALGREHMEDGDEGLHEGLCDSPGEEHGVGSQSHVKQAAKGSSGSDPARPTMVTYFSPTPLPPHPPPRLPGMPPQSGQGPPISTSSSAKPVVPQPRNFIPPSSVAQRPEVASASASVESLVDTGSTDSDTRNLDRVGEGGIFSPDSAVDVLERMARVCRQAGIILDPNLESDVSSVLSRRTTASNTVSRPSPPPSRGPALPTTPPPPPPNISRAPSAEFSSNSPPQAVEELRPQHVAHAATAADEPLMDQPVRANSEQLNVPRERSWAVPSPYHTFDKTFMSPKRGPKAMKSIPEFLLDGGKPGVDAPETDGARASSARCESLRSSNINASASSAPEESLLTMTPVMGPAAPSTPAPPSTVNSSEMPHPPIVVTEAESTAFAEATPAADVGSKADAKLAAATAAALAMSDKAKVRQEEIDLDPEEDAEIEFQSPDLPIYPGRGVDLESGVGDIVVGNHSSYSDGNPDVPPDGESQTSVEIESDAFLTEDAVNAGKSSVQLGLMWDIVPGELVSPLPPPSEELVTEEAGLGGKRKSATPVEVVHLSSDSDGGVGQSESGVGEGAATASDTEGSIGRETEGSDGETSARGSPVRDETSVVDVFEVTYHDDDVDQWEDDLDPGYALLAVSEEDFRRGEVPKELELDAGTSRSIESRGSREVPIVNSGHDRSTHSAGGGSSEATATRSAARSWRSGGGHGVENSSAGGSVDHREVEVEVESRHGGVVARCGVGNDHESMMGSGRVSHAEAGHLRYGLHDHEGRCDGRGGDHHGSARRQFHGLKDRSGEWKFSHREGGENGDDDEAPGAHGGGKRAVAGRGDCEVMHKVPRTVGHGERLAFDRGGEDGYGDSATYERDLEEAVALIERGGFVLGGGEGEREGRWGRKDVMSREDGDGKAGGSGRLRGRGDGDGGHGDGFTQKGSGVSGSRAAAAAGGGRGGSMDVGSVPQIARFEEDHAGIVGDSWCDGSSAVGGMRGRRYSTGSSVDVYTGMPGSAMEHSGRERGAWGFRGESASVSGLGRHRRRHSFALSDMSTGSAAAAALAHTGGMLFSDSRGDAIAGSASFEADASWHRHGADFVLAHELGEDEEVCLVDRDRAFSSPGERHERHERHTRHDEANPHNLRMLLWQHKQHVEAANRNIEDRHRGLSSARAHGSGTSIVTKLDARPAAKARVSETEHGSVEGDVEAGTRAFSSSRGSGMRTGFLKCGREAVGGARGGAKTDREGEQQQRRQQRRQQQPQQAQQAHKQQQGRGQEREQEEEEEEQEEGREEQGKGSGKSSRAAPEARARRGRSALSGCSSLSPARFGGRGQLEMETPLRDGVEMIPGRCSRELKPASVAGSRGDEGMDMLIGDDEDEEELDSFHLRVVFARGKTGFQESKTFDWPEGSLVAGRYEVCGYIGAAAFSTTLQCRDLRRRRGDDSVCLKVIKNNKDFFDQSLDEIKLLQRIRQGGDPDEHHVLRMLDFFYFEEHLVIVSEMLGENLYEFSKAVSEAGHPPYFTLPRVSKIARQVLEALSYVNSLGIMHCDVKPENILISNYGKAEVKLIDFGSSCFFTDRLTTYTQSRSYRAPEVVLGLRYGAKVDMWSVGAVIAELVTGNVLFQSDSVQAMLARIIGILGSFPLWMFEEGEDVPKYFTREGCVYQRLEEGSDVGSSYAGSSRFGSPTVRERREHRTTAPRYAMLIPKRTCLRRRLRVEDPIFLDFVSKLLSLDPTYRPEARDALQHPWIISGLAYSEKDLWYPPEHAATDSREGGAHDVDPVEDKARILRDTVDSDPEMPPPRRYSA